MTDYIQYIKHLELTVKNLLTENEQMKEAFSDIVGLAIDYDGYREASSLMELIDEMRGIAERREPLPLVKGEVKPLRPVWYD